MAENEEIKITYDQYFSLLNNLKQSIEIYINYRNVDLNHLVCVTTGGATGAHFLHKKMNLHCAFLAIESYGPNRIQGKIQVAPFITTTRPLYGNILLFDDLTETGKTLKKAVLKIRALYPQVKEIYPAVIFHKETSEINPRFYAQLIPKNNKGQCPWIIQPWDWEVKR